MPQFSLPNIQTGGSQTITANTLQEAQNQAQSAGTWNPGAGTYGGNSILGGAGNPVGTTPGAGLGPDLSGLQAFAAQTSGVTQKQLDQQKAEFDAQLQFARDQMTQLGIPQLQINQMLAQLQQQQFQSGLALTQQAQQYNQAATTAGLTGYFNAPPGVPSVSQWTQPSQYKNGTFVLANQGGSLGYLAGQVQNGQLVPMDWNQYVAAGGNLNNAQVIAPQAFQQQAAAPTTATAGGGSNIALDAFNTRASPADQQAYLAGANGSLTGAAANYWRDVSTKYGMTPAQLQAWVYPSAAPGQPGGSQMTMQLGQLLGQYNGMPTEAAREFNLQNALAQGQLGQQYLATAAQLQGPQNTFQLSNYLRGAQGNPNVPTYLQALANNMGLPSFQATGTTAPTPQSAAGIAGQLGGTQSATPGWDYNQTLGAIQNIMSRGAQSLGPGSIERLTPDELAALGSGLGAVGGSLPAFLQQYAQSRVGQSAPTTMGALG